MKLHRRYNTMTTFFILFSIFVVIATSVLVFSTWLEVKEKAKLELQYINTMVSSSYASDIQQNETLLGLLGARLLEVDVLHHPERAQKLIRHPLETNPSLAGFGIARKDGQLISVSYIPQNYTLPNLLEEKKSRDTFLKALKFKKMVIGRTYYMELLDKWIIPLRSPILDENGDVAFVLTTGIDLSMQQSSWNAKGFPQHIGVAIIRDDNYFTYLSDVPQEKREEWYYNPVPDNMLSQIDNVTVRSPGSNIFDLMNQKREKLLALSEYNRLFNYVSITTVTYAKLYQDLYNRLNYFILGITLFYLFTLFFYLFNQRRDQKQTDELVWSANHDILTKLPNRYFLQHKTEQWNERHRRYSALFMDLNNFKSINDNYGHPFGDKLLVVIAERLRSLMQEHEYVIRQGGDEFIALTPKPYNEIPKFAQHILHIISEVVVIDNITLYPKVTIGIAHYPHDAGTLDVLLSKADMALYKAKENKLGFLEYSMAMDEASKKRLEIELELRDAIQNDEFYMMLQPQMNAQNLEVEGVEALIRWENPKLGFIAPDQFITIAEEIGEISNLGRFALKRACQMVKRIWEETGTTFTLSVNASADELFQEDYLGQVLMILDETGFPNNQLIIEVTESLFIDDMQKATQVLNSLRNERIGVSLDDFGTGYSSLSMLKGLPVTELKIDQSFIADMLTDKQNLLLTRSIVTLGNLLDLKIVAEGVEDENQVFELQNSGCTILQGFYFAKPLDKQELVAFINGSE